MRRFAVLLSVIPIVLLAIMAMSAQPHAIAQEATPTAEEEFFPEGISFEMLGYGATETLPATPAEIAMFRFVFEPGAAFPLGPNDPSMTISYVESGTLTFLVNESPVTILRAAGMGTPFPEEMEDVEAGVEFTLAVGDSVIVTPNVTGEVRNDGSEPATVLVTLIAPLMGGMDGEADQAATPAP